MLKVSVAAVAAALVVAPIATPVGTAYAGEHLGRQSLVSADAHDVADRSPVRRVANASAPASGTALPLQGVGDVVADPDSGQVFVSGGMGVDGVTVFDSAGNVQSTLTGLSGATGMTLSPDHSTLYVALRDGNGIGIVNTSTLAVSTVPTGATTCPSSVAVTAGLVWFGYGCQAIDGAIGSLDPSTGSVDLAVATGFYYSPLLATSPALGGVLFAGEPSLSPATLVRYAVTGGNNPKATSTASTETGSNLRDLAVTPDGADVITASGSPYHHPRWKTSDLSADGAYTTAAYPNAIAINDDGDVAAGIDGSYDPDVWLFSPGASTPTRTWDFGSQRTLVPGALAFAGTNVYAVSEDSAASYRLHVLSTLPRATMKLKTDKGTYAYGGKVHLTVKVPGGDPGATVSVYATPRKGKRVLVKSGHLTSGRMKATFAVHRRTTFSAVYGGDTSHAPTTKTTQVLVRARLVSKLFRSYRKKHGVWLYHVRKDPVVAAAVRPNHAGDCLYFFVQRPHGSGWRTFAKTGCLAMDAKSAAAARLDGHHAVGERLRFRAEWRGDKDNVRKNGHWLYARFTR